MHTHSTTSHPPPCVWIVTSAEEATGGMSDTCWLLIDNHKNHINHAEVWLNLWMWSQTRWKYQTAKKYKPGRTKTMSSMKFVLFLSKYIHYFLKEKKIHALPHKFGHTNTSLFRLNSEPSNLHLRYCVGSEQVKTNQVSRNWRQLLNDCMFDKQNYRKGKTGWEKTSISGFTLQMPLLDQAHARSQISYEGGRNPNPGALICSLQGALARNVEQSWDSNQELRISVWVFQA